MHQGPRGTVGLSTECNASLFFLMAVIYSDQCSTASRSIQQCLFNLKLTNTTLCVMETWDLSCRAWWQLKQKVHFLFALLCSLCRRGKKFSVVFQWSSLKLFVIFRKIKGTSKASGLIFHWNHLILLACLMLDFHRNILVENFHLVFCTRFISGSACLMY